MGWGRANKFLRICCGLMILGKVGLIDQWGSGLKLIADELKSYPEIAFRWHERDGLQFQVQFVDTDLSGVAGVGPSF